MRDLINPPKIPDQRSPFVTWLEHLIRWCRSNHIQIQGWQYTQSNEGKLFIPPTIVIPKGGNVQGFQIVSDGGDYWICNTWNGTSAGSANFYIIKPFKLRCGSTALSAQTIRGVAYTYSYNPVYISGSSGPVAYYTRTVQVSGSTIETDYMIPDPVINDIIYAIGCTTPILPSSAMVPGNPTGGQLIDINADGRAWAT